MTKTYGHLRDQMRFLIRPSIEVLPEFYLQIMRWRYRKRPWHLDRIVSYRSWICIEGYPRSANSYLVRALKEVCDNRPAGGTGIPEWRIATHLHSPAQIKCAIRRRIPVALVVRDPLEAAVSYKALAMETLLDADWKRKVFRDPKTVSLSSLLRRYIQFHRPLARYLNMIAIYNFSRVTSDIRAVLNDLNDRFCLGLDSDKIAGLEVDQLLERAHVHVGPSETRDAVKAQLREEAMRLRGSGVLNQARTLWDRFADEARL